jgi:hypothetical protein
MKLLDLPTELFEKILHDAFQARGLKRGMRLRLVNSESLFNEDDPTY